MSHLFRQPFDTSTRLLQSLGEPQTALTHITEVGQSRYKFLPSSLVIQVSRLALILSYAPAVCVIGAKVD